MEPRNLLVKNDLQIDLWGSAFPYRTNQMRTQDICHLAFVSPHYSIQAKAPVFRPHFVL
jgi:hypothetical protein